jgi:hypothetical protein
MNSDRPSEREASEVSSYLLKVAQQESPSMAARQRALAAIGLGSAALTVTSSASAGSAISAGVSSKGGMVLGIIKWGAGGLLLGTVSMGIAAGAGLIEGQPTTPASAARAVEMPESRTLDVQEPGPARAFAPPPSPPPAVAPPSEEVAPPVERQPRSTAPAASAAPAPPQVVEREDMSSLLPEIHSLDRVRQRLAAGDAATALGMLDQHQRAFPRPALGPETAVLRIEALLKRGDRNAASNLADQFLSAYPHHPLRERVRTLTGVTH